jgi:hypothetical protein
MKTPNQPTCNGAMMLSMKIASLLLLLAAILAGCKRQGSPSALGPGTWTCEVDYPNGGHFESTTSFDPAGRYVCNGSVSSTNGTRTFTIQGIMKIEDGFIVDTFTNHSNTNASLPHTSRAKIISQNEREIVAKWEGISVASTMRRVR